MDITLTDQETIELHKTAVNALELAQSKGMPFAIAVEACTRGIRITHMPDKEARMRRDFVIAVADFERGRNWMTFVSKLVDKKYGYILTDAVNHVTKERVSKELMALKGSG